MISAIEMFFKQLFCRHKDTTFREATLIEKRHYVYGHIICKKCGKELRKITLDNL